VAIGWKNVLWGSDYPDTEGTYGHTQKMLHELFDDVDPWIVTGCASGLFTSCFCMFRRPRRPG
jgi:hypothetical protein